MFKLFSMLVVAGGTTLAGVNSAQACGGCAYSAPVPAVAKAPNASTETAQSGRQSIRRYSMAPGTTYRAPTMRYDRRSSSGPGWGASRKVLGY